MMKSVNMFYVHCTWMSLLFIIHLPYIQSELYLYLDNQTLCNEEIISLENVHTGRIYSHFDYHNQYFYMPDQHCSITIRTKKRIWMVIESFQSNSTASFPRCTEGKYAGSDDRLQIIDGYKNGSILRIICGKDSDQRFDRSALILKNSIFTIDWQTKSQSFGFQLRFILYDRTIDGKCPYANQFQCLNQRCIDQTLLCDNDDHCGDQSDLQPHSNHCGKGRAKQQKSSLMFILLFFICTSFIIICMSGMKFCRRENKNLNYGGGL